MFNKIANFFTHKDRQLRSNRWIFIIILVSAVLALTAAFALSVDAIELIKNPNTKLSCSINAIIDCAAVGKTSYSSLLGFPNSFIGMMVEPIFIVIAIAGLYKVKFPRQFMFGIQLAALFSLLFAYYLFHISVFTIQVLCPWCLLVDVATIGMFFAITRYNIREDNLYLTKKIANRAKVFIAKDYDKLTAVLLIIVAVAIIIIRFGGSLFA